MSEENQTPEAEAPAVTVNDLANAYAIIDLASKRGAFQAGELTAVGNVADKIKSFVDHITAQQEEAAEGEATEGGE